MPAPSWALHSLCIGCFTEREPKSWRTVNAKGGLPNALVEPDGLLRTRSAPREPGVAGGMGWYGVVYHVCRRHPSSEGELHAHQDGVRAAASRASPRSHACAPPRMRRCPSGRRPVERGGRDERLEGYNHGRVRGRNGRQGGGAHAADRPWRERQLARLGAPPHVPRVGARVLVASGAFAAALARDGTMSPELAVPRAAAQPPSLAHASSSHGARRTPACSPTLLACSGTR